MNVYRGSNECSAAIAASQLQVAFDEILTIDDPNVYTRPWTVAFPLNRDDNYQVFEYACHEGNHALDNMLRLGAMPNQK